MQIEAIESTLQSSSCRLGLACNQIQFSPIGDDEPFTAEKRVRKSSTHRTVGDWVSFGVGEELGGEEGNELDGELDGVAEGGKHTLHVSLQSSLAAGVLSQIA
jgi:hypothetical protein